MNGRNMTESLVSPKIYIMREENVDVWANMEIIPHTHLRTGLKIVHSSGDLIFLDLNLSH